jgi:transcription initiation factor TFIIIB Brf1 subunit/transcription initiation factor TFIIB|tara:strand:- start:88 stop:210 length:123 start_codon:yes stop_codon:yes gene_type:complete
MPEKIRPKIEEPKKCPECGSKELEREKGELYCKKCGFVID